MNNISENFNFLSISSFDFQYRTSCLLYSFSFFSPHTHWAHEQRDVVVDQPIPLLEAFAPQLACVTFLLLPRQMFVYFNTDPEHSCDRLSRVSGISGSLRVRVSEMGFWFYFQSFKKPNKIFTHKIHAGKMKRQPLFDVLWPLSTQKW